jgi:DNA-binding transcriptional LysR family regulator
LTEAGEELLGKLNPIIEGLHSALDAVNAHRDRPVGKLRLTVHPFVAVTVIAPLLSKFAAEYPEIQLDISVDCQRKDIVGERFDAGIHPENGVAQDMIAVPIAGGGRVSTVASPDYLDRSAPLSTPDDLTQHNCIRYCWANDETGRRPWKFKRADRQIEVGVTGSLEVNNLDLALRAGLDGVGVVQLPEVSVASYVAEGRLAPVLPEWSPQWADFVLFFSSRRHVPVKLRALVDFLRRESRRSAYVECGEVVERTAPIHLRPQIDAARSACPL